MKLLQYIYGFLSLGILLFMFGCSTRSDVLEINSDFTTNQDLCTMYYEQAKNIFQMNCLSTRGITDAENDFERYSALGEKFSNITKLSETDLRKTVNEASYEKLVTSYENSLGSEIFDFVTIQEYKQTCQLLQQYLLLGGHSMMKLMAFIPQTTQSKNLIKLSSYAASVLDEYIEDHIFKDMSLEIVSDITSCEEILIAQLAILAIDVAFQCGIAAIIPPSWVSAGLTSVYALATAALRVAEYYACVKRRDANNDDDIRP